MMTNTVGRDLDVPDVWRAAQFVKSLKQFEAADNDLAMGQVLEAVSHGKFWKDTCVFAIEDDPQNGWDRVSGCRTTAYVASAYTRRGAVVHTQYNQPSLLRTMELMLGLPPMNQMDATATPMFDCFTNTPDFAAFEAVTNNVPLDEMNSPLKNLFGAQARKDAVVSSRLPLDKPDQCPEDVLNQILWRAAKGSSVAYPFWAVKATEDND